MLWLRAALRFACILTLSVSPLLAQPRPTLMDDELLSLESPVVQRILRRASLVEHRSGTTGDQESAMRLYCAASRLGSLEAQFRLGKMLLEGRGVSKSFEKAATLFSIAAGNGHEGATAMLSAIGTRKISLPDCLVNPRFSV